MGADRLHLVRFAGTSEWVDIDDGQLVGRGLNDIAVVMRLHHRHPTPDPLPKS